MSLSVYSSLGSTFGKLHKAKPKPIILANTISAHSIPFLQGFRSGSTSLKALDDGIIEEISEDIFETIYMISLNHKGVIYSIQISETRDCWLLKNVQINISGANLSVNKNKKKAPAKKKPVTLSFFLLIFISVAGYAYEFGFNKDQSEQNPSVFEVFSKAGSQPVSSVQEEVSDSPQESSGAVEQGNEHSEAPTSQAAEQEALSEEKKLWEDERAVLEAKIAELQKENEALKKQLAEGIPFIIAPGTNPMNLAQSAASAGIVGSAEEFHQALLKSNAGDHIVPGKYMILPGTTYEALIEEFTKGIIKP